MKRKLSFGLMMLATLFAASCAKELVEAPVQSEEAMVTFSVNTPEIATRAYSDGTTATKLQYAVYDKAGVELTALTETDATINGSATVELQLTTGNTYSVIFWAAAPNAPYRVDLANKTMTADYTNALSNDETLDAFYACKTFTVTGVQTETIELRRPFAQLNIGTADYAASTSAGYTPTHSSVTVKDVYTTLNLATGEVDDMATVEFSSAAIPTTETFPVAGNQYVAMNYILVDAEKEVVDVEFTYTDGANAKTRTVGSVPVQRNYRTNIYGNILTSEVDINVEIVPEYEEPSYELYNVVVAGVSYDDFAVAAAKAMELSKPVEFIQNVTIDADNTITVPAGKELTLNLNGYTLSGVTDVATSNRVMFDVRGTMNVDGTNTLTKAATGANGSITVKHIGENMKWNAMHEIFYVGFNGTLNVNDAELINFGGTDMAYCIDMVNASAPNGATVNVDNATLKCSYIPVRVFNNGAGMNTVNIANTTLESTGGKMALWVHIFTKEDNGGTEKDATLTLNIFNPPQNNTFIPNENPVGLGFDNRVYTDQYGVIALTDAEGNVVEGIGKDMAGNYAVTAAPGLEYLSALVASDDNNFAGKTVKLAADIDLTGVTTNGDSFAPIGSTGERDNRNRLVCEPFKGTFDGQDHTIKGLYQSGWDMGYEWGQYGSIGLFAELEGATVKNVTLEDFEAQVEGGDISFVAGSATGDCVFENITIKNSSIGTYNNGCGGIIGWSGEGTYTFKDITIGKDVVLGGLWGSFDSSIGGVVGQAEPGATYNFENVTINCRIDAYNDCTASYDYYNYRMCGMVIGRCEETTTIDGTNYPDLSKYNMTFNNVVVNYGDWMNYHYCRKSGERAVRVEPGYAYGGISADRDHSTDNVHCMEWIPFNQLIGGDQYAVKGLPAVDGITVNYPESYYREFGYKVNGDTYTVLTGAGFKKVATEILSDASKTVTIELANDIDLEGIEWPAVATKAAFVLDGKGKSIKNLTTTAVEDHGFYSTAMFTSTRKAATIKNLVVENATVTGKGGDNSHGAVLVACNYDALNIEGVTVKNSTVSNCDRSSALVTYLYFTTATVKDCVVEGCTVNSIGTAGALLGMNNSHNFEATGNTVKGTTISSSEGGNKAGILIGTWQNAGTLTESNNVVENSKAINAGAETNNNVGRTV